MCHPAGFFGPLGRSQIRFSPAYFSRLTALIHVILRPAYFLHIEQILQPFLHYDSFCLAFSRKASGFSAPFHKKSAFGLRNAIVPVKKCKML
jgi:hypothetical protein